MSEKYTTNTLDDLVVDGHFELASGRHSLKKVDFELVDQFSGLREEIALSITSLIFRHFDVVPLPNAIVGVPSGATSIASGVSELIKTSISIPMSHLEAKKSGSSYKINSRALRSYRSELSKEIIFEPSAIVIEDVVTTGGSTKRMIDYLNSNDIETKLVCSVWDRGEDNSYINGVPHLSLKKELIPDFDPLDCPYEKYK